MFDLFQRKKEMSKKLRHVTRKKGLAVTPEKKHALRSNPFKGVQNERAPCDQLERVFDILPESIIICDQEGKIVRLNAAALKLFEVSALAHWRGKSYQQFLQNYELCDEQQRLISPEESCLMNPVSDDEAGSGSPEKMLILYLPSRRKVYVDSWCLPVFDSQRHAVGTVSVYHAINHRCQKALHLQRVYEAVLNLTNAISHLPVHIDLVTPEEVCILSPPVTFVAQQLVNVISQVLNSRRVSLLAYGTTGHQYYVAGTGLTTEQEQYWQKIKGRVLPTEFVDETVLARLSANQEVIIAGDCVHLPLQFRSEFDTENYLLVPLFREYQWVGTLVIAKAGPNSGYLPEEVALVRAV